MYLYVFIMCIYKHNTHIFKYRRICMCIHIDTCIYGYTHFEPTQKYVKKNYIHSIHLYSVEYPVHVPERVLLWSGHKFFTKLTNQFRKRF